MIDTQQYQLYQCLTCNRRRTFGLALDRCLTCNHSEEFDHTPLLICHGCGSLKRHYFVGNGVRPAKESERIHAEMRDHYAAIGSRSINAL